VSRWRQARAIALLPGVATLLVPALILLLGTGPEVGWGLGGALAVAPVLAGLVLIGAGIAMWAWTVRLFSRLGRGTLAPWDPTRRLVVEGPYRHVRNPMISAVLGTLLGEAALLGSVGIAIWAAAFAAVNTAYFILSEEPGLERRFGDQYAEYKRHVPRWIPSCARRTRSPT
jgi:protein-S-isoprenylcysteine O-methyltransferase Ste14